MQTVTPPSSPYAREPQTPLSPYARTPPRRSESRTIAQLRAMLPPALTPFLDSDRALGSLYATKVEAVGGIGVGASFIGAVLDFTFDKAPKAVALQRDSVQEALSLPPVGPPRYPEFSRAALAAAGATEGAAFLRDVEKAFQTVPTSRATNHAGGGSGGLTSAGADGVSATSWTQWLSDLVVGVPTVAGSVKEEWEEAVSAAMPGDSWCIVNVARLDSWLDECLRTWEGRQAVTMKEVTETLSTVMQAADEAAAADPGCLEMLRQRHVTPVDAAVRLVLARGFMRRKLVLLPATSGAAAWLCDREDHWALDEATVSEASAVTTLSSLHARVERLAGESTAARQRALLLLRDQRDRAGAKRALAASKRFAQQADGCRGMAANVETVVDAIEQARLNALTTTAMRDASRALSQRTLSVDEVDEVMLDAAEQLEQAQAVEDALGAEVPGMASVTDEDVAADLAELEAEVAGDEELLKQLEQLQVCDGEAAQQRSPGTEATTTTTASTTSRLAEAAQ